jgi:hypothetical protein
MHSPIVTFPFQNASTLSPRLTSAKEVLTLQVNHARTSHSVFNAMAATTTFPEAIGTQ